MPDGAFPNTDVLYLDYTIGRGLMTGYTDGSGRFGPGDHITREQLATMIARYCEGEGMAATDGNVSMFRDGESISGWARDGVAFCYEHEIVSGIGATGDFAPRDVALRCQMSKIIAVTARLLE